MAYAGLGPGRVVVGAAYDGRPRAMVTVEGETGPVCFNVTLTLRQAGPLLEAAELDAQRLADEFGRAVELLEDLGTDSETVRLLTAEQERAQDIVHQIQGAGRVLVASAAAAKRDVLHDS